MDRPGRMLNTADPQQSSASAPGRSTTARPAARHLGANFLTHFRIRTQPPSSVPRSKSFCFFFQKEVFSFVLF
jgi:hypothetical protein